VLRTQDLARRSGVTSRTLRHYHEVGLLRPASVDPGGQRWYGPAELVRLQRILVLRELGLPLDEIARVLDGDTDDVSALTRHVGQLRSQQARVERMIRAVESTITRMELGMTMDEAEMFEGFADDPYEQEAQQRWPDQYAESRRRLERRSKQQQRELLDRGSAVTAAIGAQFSGGASADSPPVQALVGQHYAWVDEFWTPDRDAYVALGRMYVDDPRFAANYESLAPGLATFMRDAMAVWAAANLSVGG
jgi:DNA-binding transcriptional MerR regulator